MKQLYSPLKPQDYLSLLKARCAYKQLSAYKRILEIAQTVQQAGGKALLVGGCVRDMLLGTIHKDFDLEIYHLTPQKVESLLTQFGKVSEIGKAFSVYKVILATGVAIEVSLPRRDSKNGIGHRGFKVTADPNMSIKEAARRRDFTINAILLDPLNSTIYDPFGGIKDLKESRLRVVDSKRFCDDPLRVLRAIQFIARFKLSLDSKSAQIIRKMSPYLKELPAERILEEWKKLLLLADKPSLGLQAGMELGIFSTLHPEFIHLPETPQNPEWHPEGDVWTHTLICMDNGAKIVRREKLNEQTALTVMLAILCHDLGKSKVTQLKDEKYISPQHSIVGIEPTKSFLKTIGVDTHTCKKVLALVKNHLVPVLLYNAERQRQEKVTDSAVRRLAHRLYPATIYELVLVAEADYFGKTTEEYTGNETFPAGSWLLERAQMLDAAKRIPPDVIRGRDLLALGFEPGPHIGRIINIANKLRDEKGLNRDEILNIISQHIRRKPDAQKDDKDSSAKSSKIDPERAIEKLKRFLKKEECKK
jgi:tRNA nucleotidyltransferase (CCA-adding enzyme)